MLTRIVSVWLMPRALKQTMILAWASAGGGASSGTVLLLGFT